MRYSDLTLDREGLAAAIACEDAAFEEALREEAYRVKVATIGPEVYLRGLIEVSNICVKNCLYCGIRRGISCQRYELSEDEVLATAQIAARRHFGSVVIQGGERTDAAFVRKITRLLKAIKSFDTGEDPPLGITLSLGEQSRDVYEEWFDAGAHRYLLRIESSNPDLFRKIHPDDPLHSYDRRLQALYDLKEIGYQAGTGAMIGMPFQTAADMADDLLFFKEFDAPMVGMGPYNPHPDTPLTISGAPYPSAERRFSLGLKMIALLRLLMPDINIAAATALEILDPCGREKGIMSGANVIMPNITPAEQMIKYNLYDRKTLNASNVDDLKAKGIPIGFSHWGDSKHFRRKELD
ncbi:MAG: [FeFe] hydrogenase H-cluster radical SAM maturase HydE [Bacteroidales bacterium]|nr:[FeFe] hydrogenase H-cluster radical SAM maturase HydE [Bacteroidales bacterium]